MQSTESNTQPTDTKTQKKEENQPLPKDIRTEILESGSPLLQKSDDKKPKPSYFSQK